MGRCFNIIRTVPSRWGISSNDTLLDNFVIYDSLDWTNFITLRLRFISLPNGVLIRWCLRDSFRCVSPPDRYFRFAIVVGKTFRGFVRHKETKSGPSSRCGTRHRNFFIQQQSSPPEKVHGRYGHLTGMVEKFRECILALSRSRITRDGISVPSLSFSRYFVRGSYASRVKTRGFGVVRFPTTISQHSGSSVEHRSPTRTSVACHFERSVGLREISANGTRTGLRCVNFCTRSYQM